MRTALFIGVIALGLALPDTGHAQLSPSANWAAHAANQYRVVPDLTYLTASNYESKLDTRPSGSFSQRTGCSVNSEPAAFQSLTAR